MITSDNGRNLIESFEGLSSRAYQDIRGIWTIGYGHTQNVEPNDFVSPEKADLLLSLDLNIAEDAVNRMVTVDLNQNQFDALVSLTFNIGKSAFFKSTLLNLLNRSDYAGAAAQFLVWDKADGRTAEGLLNRRIAERNLFETEPS